MAVSDASLVNQPVFPYTRMRTRKVGGGNARKIQARFQLDVCVEEAGQGGSSNTTLLMTNIFMFTCFI